MKRASRYQISPLLLLLISATTLFSSASVHADSAVLVDYAVMVETNPEAAPLVEGEEPAKEEEVGTQTNASYVSTGGWAVTGEGFIDAAAFVFDFLETGTVSQATLTLPIETLYLQNGASPIEISFWADNGWIEYTDYSIGFVTPILEIDATGLTVIEVDVTGAVNASLGAGRYVGFRVKSSVAPGSVDTTVIPPYVGVNLIEDAATLQFTLGAPPAVPGDSARFDGYTLEVPAIEVPTLGEVAAQFRLVDPNELRFQLT